MILPSENNCTIAIIGLGYVGLPLAVEITKNKFCLKTKKKLSRKVIGYDLNQTRINELRKGIDITNELNKDELEFLKDIDLSYDSDALDEADVFIVTVPTPIDEAKKPNLNPLINASKVVGMALKRRFKSKNHLRNIKPIIIYESTVYPGATEEICIPIIKEFSSLNINSEILNLEFSVGYSPERINPGDKLHRITNIVKVTSGSDDLAAKWIDNFYASFISAGTYLAKNIKVAEAAKIIENTQRDINIALINELSMIFRKMNIDIFDVLDAAQTKWNFLPFKPGLVGGHCIGVDPYYLTYKAEKIGYYPQMVLAGRRINDDRAKWIVNQIILEMAKRKISIIGSKILILGFTFKANCPDIRNTKVYDLVKSLEEYGLIVDVIDPMANIEDAKYKYDINIASEIPFGKKYNLLLAAVNHSDFKHLEINSWLSFVEKNYLMVDLQGIIPRELNPLRI